MDIDRQQESVFEEVRIEMDPSVISSVGLPTVTIMISLVSIYINSLHRSVDFAKNNRNFKQETKIQALTISTRSSIVKLN